MVTLKKTMIYLCDTFQNAQFAHEFIVYCLDYDEKQGKDETLMQ
jgi:hypothetical protein